MGLQLQPLETNPGILPVKEGQAYLQIDNWTIIKTINLDNIYNDLNYVTSRFSDFNKLVEQHKPYPRELVGMITHVEHLRDMTINKYRQLIPQRFRRGILNPLGSILKIITGNLDHEDALKYDKLTSELSKNQDLSSKKLTIISKMMDSFINTTEIINNNSLTLESHLKRIDLTLRDIIFKEDNWILSSYILGLYNLFISHYRTIFVKLSELETALALSKTSILHQSIVNSSELLDHLKLISRTEKLVYEPTVFNLVKLEETICIKSFIKKEQITFIMQIPLTDNCTYNYYKMYSLPIFLEPENKTLAIFPKYPYLLAKGLKYLPLVAPCRPLAAGDNFLCTGDNRVLYPDPTCEEQLMQFAKNLSYCKQHVIKIEEVRVQRISTENWILYTRLRTTLTKKCAEEISKYPVFGTYVLTLNEPCDLEIHGIQIHHHRIYTEAEATTPYPVINLPLLPMSTNVSSASALNMHEVSLDEVKYMSYALKNSEVMNSVYNRENDPSLSALIYLSLSLIVLTCLVLVFYMFRNKIVKWVPLRNYRNNSKIEISDNFSLREGGVIHPPHPADTPQRGIATSAVPFKFTE